MLGSDDERNLHAVIYCSSSIKWSWSGRREIIWHGTSWIRVSHGMGVQLKDETIGKGKGEGRGQERTKSTGHTSLLRRPCKLETPRRGKQVCSLWHSLRLGTWVQCLGTWVQCFGGLGTQSFWNDGIYGITRFDLAIF
jgi:hypothetical protein